MHDIVRIENVSKGYLIDRNHELRSVIREISFSIKPRTTTALMGANGTGKTTLMRLIAGLDVPSDGTIQWITGKAEPRVELMFQDFRSSLFPWSSINGNLNCEKSGDHYNPELARSILGRYLPLLSPGARVAKLSGGEQQAVALARALARDCDLLLLDEPFSSLDLAVREQALLSCREALVTNRIHSILITTHSLQDVAVLADHVILLGKKPAKIICEFELPDNKRRDDPGVFAACIQLLKDQLNKATKHEEAA